jgi:hypothetical protein
MDCTCHGIHAEQLAKQNDLHQISQDPTVQLSMEKVEHVFLITTSSLEDIKLFFGCT